MNSIGDRSRVVYPRPRFMAAGMATILPFWLAGSVSEWFLLLMAVTATMAVQDLARVAQHDASRGPVAHALRAVRAHRWAQLLLFIVLLTAAVIGATIGPPATFLAGGVIWCVLVLSCVPIFQHVLERGSGQVARSPDQEERR